MSMSFYHFMYYVFDIGIELMSGVELMDITRFFLDLQWNFGHDIFLTDQRKQMPIEN